MHRMRRNVLVTAASALVLAPFVIFAWTGPSASPPNGNVAAPINVGTTDQVKNGNLGVNALAVFGNSLFGGSTGSGAYLNFGATSGTNGYGIRDNAGLLEFKNSGGSWESIQATVFNLVGGTGSWAVSGNNIYSNNTGNVGIGTANPGAKLDVRGGLYVVNTDWVIASTGSGFSILTGAASGDTYTGIQAYTSGAAGAGNLILNAIAGNVGIGTVSPNAKLHVYGGSGNQVSTLVEGQGSNSTAASLDLNAANALGQVVEGGPTYGNWGRGYSLNIINANMSGPITFNHWAGPNDERENMRIAANGNVGIGTTNPGYKLDVAGTVRTSGFSHADGMYQNNGDWYVCLHGSDLVYGAYCSASDARLKKNIEPLKNVLATLDDLHPVTFDWIDPTRGTHRQIGVLAQDFQKDYPELVASSSTSTDSYLAFDYQRFTAVLLGGIKELAVKVSETAHLLKTDRVETKELCVQESDGTYMCVTGDQLAALLAK